MLDQHREKAEHAEWLAGTLASAIVNYGFIRTEQWRQPADFFPRLPRMKEKKKRVNREQVANDIRSMFAPYVKK